MPQHRVSALAIRRLFVVIPRVRSGRRQAQFTHRTLPWRFVGPPPSPPQPPSAASPLRTASSARARRRSSMPRRRPCLGARYAGDVGASWGGLDRMTPPGLIKSRGPRPYSGCVRTNLVVTPPNLAWDRPDLTLVRFGCGRATFGRSPSTTWRFSTTLRPTPAISNSDPWPGQI